jgi:hypothetical protein
MPAALPGPSCDDEKWLKCVYFSNYLVQISAFGVLNIAICDTSAIPTLRIFGAGDSDGPANARSDDAADEILRGGKASQNTSRRKATPADRQLIKLT